LSEVEQLVNAFTVNEIISIARNTTSMFDQRFTDGTDASDRAGQFHSYLVVAMFNGGGTYSIALWLLENWPPVDTFDIE